MISELTLNMAVEQAIISSAQADSLKLIESSLVKNRDFQTPDHEKIRFISGFGDIFVFIGIALFLGASGYFLSDFRPKTIMWIVLSALSWGLAELFSRRQKMAFPSIILLVTFSIFSFLGMFLITLTDDYNIFSNGINFKDYPWQLTIAALITCGLIALHYWRFRVPITIAAGAFALAIAAYALLLGLAPNFIVQLGSWLFLAIGLLIFALAMRFDARDLTRQTRNTDIAFWLHLLAAPLIVHSLIRGLFGSLDQVNLPTALGVLFIFMVLAIIAVLIDRRAILVSGLVYAGIAFANVLKQTALSNVIIPASILTLGAFILVLSIGWTPLRNLILRALPASIRLKLPTSTALGAK
jgi:hypothetical protein